MPAFFDFSSDFTSENFVSQTVLTRGAGSGIDNTALFSAIGGSFTYGPNDIRVVPIAIHQGQVLSLDVDFGTSNNINPVDTKLWLIDAAGALLASNDNSGSDLGSTGSGDPKLSYTAAVSGLVFAVVAQKDNGYVGGTFEFDDHGTDSGVFQLNLGIADLTALTTGTGEQDVMNLTAAQRRFDALGGNDSITAADVRNVIDGGMGDDFIYGASKSDIFFGGNGRDQLLGQGGDDTLIGGRGGDDLFGGDGNDQIMSGNGSDYLHGEAGNDIMAGEEGEDQFDGGLGNDKMYGGADNDMFFSEAGDDTMDGGEDSDSFSVSSAGALKLDLAITTAQDTGSFGFDTFIGIENVYGGSLSDTISGNDVANVLYGQGGGDILGGFGGNDLLNGGTGDDTLRGGSGDDQLWDAEGNDMVYGGSGDDSIYAGSGIDHLWGNAGADGFLFIQADTSPPGTPDVIEDFVHAEDVIFISALGGGHVTWRGDGPFQSTGPEVRVQNIGSYQMVYVSTDTDAAAEFAVRVSTATALVETDFYLG